MKAKGEAASVENAGIAAAVVNDLVAEVGNSKAFDAKDFARRLYRRELFTSDMIRPGDERLIPSIFTPLLFSGKEILEIGDVTCLYAEMSEAGPCAINGYPIFFSVQTLKRDEHIEVMAEYRKILIVMGELTDDENPA